MTKKQIVVISLGGSIIAPPEGVDVKFLQDFKRMIVGLTSVGFRFIIVCGGGSTARRYQAAAKAVGELNPEDVDWIGIHATRLNGHLLRSIFRKLAYPIMIKDLSKKFRWNTPVLVGAGWKPGWSTDYVAVKLVEMFGADQLINLSNISYVYDRDPKEKGAKRIESMTWAELQKIVGTKWEPGANTPFDPVATKTAKKLGLKLAFVKGAELEEVKKAIVGEKFAGTVVV